jgi:hypothetical protein
MSSRETAFVEVTHLLLAAGCDPNELILTPQPLSDAWPVYSDTEMTTWIHHNTR